VALIAVQQQQQPARRQANKRKQQAAAQHKPHCAGTALAPLIFDLIHASALLDFAFAMLYRVDETTADVEFSQFKEEPGSHVKLQHSDDIRLSHSIRSIPSSECIRIPSKDIVSTSISCSSGHNRWLGCVLKK
jgi:hypothetical protein